MISAVIDHLRLSTKPAARTTTSPSHRARTVMRLGLACITVMAAGAPGAVVAQQYSPRPYVPVIPYGTYGLGLDASQGRQCLQSSDMTGVVASNDHEVILRFGRDNFYRVRLSRACPALVGPGANVASVKSSTGGIICNGFDVKLKVVAGDGSVSSCTGDTLAKMSSSEVKTEWP
jgi:hypothetical protein